MCYNACMNYTKYTLIISPQDEELASYLLFECSAAGLQIINPNDTTVQTGDDTYDYVDANAFCTGILPQWLTEHPNKLFITLFFEQKNGLKRFLKQAKTMLQSEVVVKKELVNDSTWLNEWKKYYKPFKVGECNVVPTWLDDAVLPNKIVIDPGIAFGTGQHETTGMILEQLKSSELSGKRVADVGCGSGILGIGALKLGAKSCHFVDVEKRAIAICRQNCLSSSVLSGATFFEGAFAAETDKTYDVILANLTASILQLVCSDIAKSLTSGGKVFASGIIDGTEQQVKQAFMSCGLTDIAHYKRGGWHAITFKKEGK